MEERDYYLSFSYFPGIGPKRFELLLKYFGSAKNAWNGAEAEIKNCVGKITGENLVRFRKTFSIEKELGNLERKKISFITLTDKDYPKLLKELIIARNISRHSELAPLQSSKYSWGDSESPEGIPGQAWNDRSKNDSSLRNGDRIPFLLYVKGNISLLNALPSIAVVGTRKITSYGRDVTISLTEELVKNNFVIVSGLAFGVDATAHTTAIENKGKTIAVLGCGVDCCTPTSNQQIYDSILDNGGTIISSFRPGEQAVKGSFPARNAIVAGLSLGVLVTEGAFDSGALITADCAKKYNRPIFAVPGQITSGLSKAPNGLIQKGAVPVTEAEDIIRVILSESERSQSKSKLLRKKDSGSLVHQNDNLSKEEKEILSLLESGPMHFDNIVRAIGKSSSGVGSLLSMMEIKGIIKNSTGMYSL